MGLTIDELAGGLVPEKDLVFASRPDDPAMRESISVWLYDDEGRFAIPRMGIEAEAASWDDRRVQGNFAFADGRVLNGVGIGAAHSPIGPDGRPTVLGAGPISFRCVEPFRRWTMHWRGPVRDGTVQEQIGNRFGTGGTVEVALDVEMEMAAPAWVQNYAADAAMSEIERDNAGAMGFGYRIEQLFHATGTLHIGGESHAFTGRGTRVHRQSVRTLAGFFGHCWLSATFPNGDAFGSLAYPPREGSGGDYSYNDAFLYKDGRWMPARIAAAPLLHRIVPSGDAMALVLDSELGRTTINAMTGLSTFRIGNPDIGGLNLQQGGALYRWDGQEAWGMVERSAHASLTTIG